MILPDVTGGMGLNLCACGNPATVQVTVGGELVYYCWTCGAPDYRLQAQYACLECGRDATVQVTTGDGITRPYCPECAGVLAEDLSDYEY